MATLAELQALKAKYEAARDKILVAQSYSEGATRVQKAELEIIQKYIDDLDARISRLTYGTRLTPVFKRAK